MRFQDIVIGSVCQFERQINVDDGLSFAKLTGDTNPLHTSAEFAEQSPFGRTIVHGLLIGGLFSTLVGVHCPGDNCLYVSQTLQFKAPVFYGDVVVIRGIVTDKHDSISMVRMKTEALVNGEVKVTGEAVVKVL